MRLGRRGHELELGVLRYKLTIAYEGTNFCGWQRQLPHEDAVPSALTIEPAEDLEFLRDAALPLPSAETGVSNAQAGTPVAETTSADDRPRVELRTVQAVVERAVRYVVREPVVIHGASRTDSGVHAKGQVCAFTCSDRPAKNGGGWPLERGTDTLVRALNARLPDDVLVVKAEVVPETFNPITDCVSKGYSYRIWTGRDRPLWERRTCLHIWQELDHRLMHEGARALVGEHDFAAFAAAGHGRKSTVRRVFDCSVVRESEQMLLMNISGNGFLWNMVRIIAGTLVECGKIGGSGPRMNVETVREVLGTGDRRKAGPTLPPQGLTLEWIKYGGA
jgi:tRNA pseudouridine38-40 synthase